MKARETTFDIPKMDCPSEERLIRMTLDKASGIRNLEFDLSARRLAVVHLGPSEDILRLLEPLGFGAKLSSAREVTDEVAATPTATEEGESRVLRQVFVLNGAMFFVELALGLYAQSTGLIADSLDMFADAAVYGMSLYAIGKSASLKKRSARLSGYLQLILALGALLEVGRRFFYDSEPAGTLMMSVAAIALVVNVTCMVLLAKHRKGEVHMEASWIFSTNDVIANAGVILAGLLVHLTGSAYPDLLIGAIIGLIVLSGAARILRISKT